MRPNAGIRLWVFLLLSALALRAFSQQIIKTDTQGGIFRNDQKLSFSISEPGWFRLLLDGREIYRGRSPAYPELGVPQGEERAFTLRAEYYSPSNELKESLSWHIFIDKKPPPLPALEFRNTQEGLRLVKTGGDSTVKIRAISDADGTLAFFPDLEDPAALPVDFYPSDSFPALIWAEDLAGNNSEFKYEYFDISFVKLENPVPGEWLNEQTLIITGTEGRSIYWTSDGTHPLESGGSGRLYRGPERIKRTGLVTLRIAWREADGRIREDRAVYTVTGREVTGEKLVLLGKAEETVINAPTAFQLPENWLWSISDAPREQLEARTVLRPEGLVNRAVSINLSPGQGAGVYRFAYLLDAGGKTGDRQTLPREMVPVKKEFLYPIEDKDSFPPLTLVSAGSCRAVVWPPVEGNIYYSWGGLWHEAKGPLPVPLQGGNLRWFMLERESNFDPDYVEQHSVGIDSRPGTRAVLGGRIALRQYRGSGSWEYVSGLYNYTPGLVRNPGIDVCEGEDLVWAFISSGGRILEQQRRNRLSPPAPEILGLPPGGWTRGSVQLSVSPGEEGRSGIIEATLRYASGAVEKKSGSLSLEIYPPPRERIEVTAEAWLLDSNGNRGPAARRSFTIDPKTIYVSAVPLLEKASGAPGRASAPGDMDNPFRSLDEALSYAEKEGIDDVRIAGDLELARTLTVGRYLHIEGGWREDGKDRAGSENNRAFIKLGDRFSWNLRPGAALVLSGFSAERQGSGDPLIQAGRNGKVEISDIDILNTGPLITADGGSIKITNSKIQLKIPGERRSAAISAGETSVELKDSSIRLEGDYSLILDLRGGSFCADECEFIARGNKTASLLVLNRARGNLNGLVMEAAARDYASALEASGAEILLYGGKLDVSARDSSAIVLQNCSAILLDADIKAGGVFSTRAVEITGSFPLVRNCRFFSGAGTTAASSAVSIPDSAGGAAAARSEVFSGTDVPKAGNITGNQFSGFTHIWGPGWPVERLKAFNQDYASPDKPNTLTLRP